MSGAPTAGRSVTAPVGVLVMAHGTPQSLDQVEPFYTEIRRGHRPTPELLAELRSRYEAIGGTSPLNATTRAQATGIAQALDARAAGCFVVRNGSRFAAPRIEDAAAELVDLGVTAVVGLVLAPHSSVVSVTQYAERARAALEPSGVALEMVDHWYDAPGFSSACARRVGDALSSMAARGIDTTQVDLVFSAHSVPVRALGDGGTGAAMPYDRQLVDSAAAVAHAAGVNRWSVAWQSAGRTDDEWLGPDIREVIRRSAQTGAAGVLVCPIGFVADHLEVLYDIDIEAAAVARQAGISLTRTAAFNADGDFCSLLADVVLGTDVGRRQVDEAEKPEHAGESR
ncbi:MAG: ferrochelatase [Acidimicrobiales bacterium]